MLAAKMSSANIVYSLGAATLTTSIGNYVLEIRPMVLVFVPLITLAAMLVFGIFSMWVKSKIISLKEDQLKELKRHHAAMERKELDKDDTLE